MWTIDDFQLSLSQCNDAVFQFHEDLGEDLDELDTEECLSHQQCHFFVVPKPMILPQVMARSNERLSLEKGTLTDADKEKVSKACDASCATRRLPPMRI